MTTSLPPTRILQCFSALLPMMATICHSVAALTAWFSQRRRGGSNQVCRSAQVGSVMLRSSAALCIPQGAHMSQRSQLDWR